MRLSIRSKTIKKLFVFIVILCIASFPLVHSTGAEYRIPSQDTGLSGLLQMMQKLRTTARMIHTTAHPDDEDGGMLTYEARGVGASVLLFTLNRGEGGQNKTGSELFDSLGILRTEELLAADSYYGVEQRFSHVVDFGYSKNSKETLEKWQGQDTALSDMVRVIRTFKPDVLVSRFQGNASDGHGHHETAGVLTPIAFKAAADPNRFPEQIKEGLLPWQAKKLYMGAGQNGTLRIDTGVYDPALGMSYAQFSLEGLSHQLSQGSGGGRVPPGPRYSSYRLADAVINTGVAGPGHEQNFFDGIDTSIPGLAGRLGSDASKLPSLRQDLTGVAAKVDEATNALSPQDPSKAAAPLLAGLNQVRKIIAQVEGAGLSPAVQNELLTSLRTKEAQFAKAANLALGVTLDVVVEAADAGGGAGRGRRNQQSILIATPGQTFNISARLYNRSRQTIEAKEIKLETPEGWKATPSGDLKKVGPNENALIQFQVTVPENAQYTRPYWHRNDSQVDPIYTIDNPKYQNLPFPEYPVHARAIYQLGDSTGEVRNVAEVSYTDPMYGQERRPLAVGPALSVELQPATQIIATDRETASDITVGVRNNSTEQVNGTLKLEVPSGWKCQPASQPITFTKAGEFNSYQFKVTPNEKQETVKQIKAVAEYNGKKYDEGYSVVVREDLASFYYYSPAMQKVSTVNVKILQNLRIGYIMGAGDSIPAVLKQIGINVELITPTELSSGDLSRFDTIVAGIRAYDVRNDIRENNKRLLDYVQRGGTFIVQYNQSNTGAYTPYKASQDPSNKRVTVEEAPVDILQPKDSVFLYPNKIDAKDFDNWIQERGAYFMGDWDQEHFKSLMSSTDPDEAPLSGGMLRAQYGKGTYIFTGYAFFRQLPAGVPGATRLFVNILSAGHDK